MNITCTCKNEQSIFYLSPFFSVDCSAPTAVQNRTTPTYTDTTYEEVAVHTCSEKYGFDDYAEQHESYCEIDGYWSDIPASCVGKFMCW